MEWADHLFAPFFWVRGIFGDREDGEVFLLALACGVVLAGSAGVVMFVSLRSAALAVERAMKKLVPGAELSELERVEAVSAKIERTLWRLSLLVVRTGSREVGRQDHIPRAGSERGTLAIGRWILRRVLLAVRAGLVVLATLPRAVMTVVGGLIVALAALAAFPHVTRDLVNALVDSVASITWTEASTITVAAAGGSLIVLLLKVVVSDKVAARRAVRRRNDEAALDALVRATPAIAALANALREQTFEMVHSFKVERYHAQEWREWVTGGPVVRPTSWRPDEHTRCNRDCLQEQSADACLPPRELKTATDAVARAWGAGLKEHVWVLGRLTNRKAWRGLVALKWEMSANGGFRMSTLPCEDKWRRQRIAWQHRQLRDGDLSDADIAAGRDVAAEVACAPTDRWLEDELVDVVWRLTRLARELTDLVAFSDEILRPHRLEPLMRAAGG